MANNRIWLRCKVCGEVLTIAVWHPPRWDVYHDDMQQRLEKFLDEHDHLGEGCDGHMGTHIAAELEIEFDRRNKMSDEHREGAEAIMRQQMQGPVVTRLEAEVDDLRKCIVQHQRDDVLIKRELRGLKSDLERLEEAVLKLVSENAYLRNELKKQQTAPGSLPEFQRKEP